MDTLVDADWLAEHLADPDLVVLDCTVTMTVDAAGVSVRSGRHRFDEGHVPGAVHADLTSDLADTSSPNRFAVPTPEAFCAAMEALGVGDGRRAVLYDQARSMWAARVWWMLRWVGFDDAALLDGGLDAWTEAGHELSTDPPRERTTARLTPSVRPALIAGRDEVRSAIDDDTVALIDSLPADHYHGRTAMYGRPGHIPSACNVPVGDVVDATGRFRTLDELAELYGDATGRRTITYCGGGIAASAAAFALTRLGVEDVGVYTASLQEWAADPDNPLEADG